MHFSLDLRITFLLEKLVGSSKLWIIFLIFDDVNSLSIALRLFSFNIFYIGVMSSVFQIHFLREHIRKGLIPNSRRIDLPLNELILYPLVFSIIYSVLRSHLFSTEIQELKYLFFLCFSVLFATQFSKFFEIILARKNNHKINSIVEIVSSLVSLIPLYVMDQDIYSIEVMVASYIMIKVLCYAIICYKINFLPNLNLLPCKRSVFQNQSKQIAIPVVSSAYNFCEQFALSLAISEVTILFYTANSIASYIYTFLYGNSVLINVIAGLSDVREIIKIFTKVATELLILSSLIVIFLYIFNCTIFTFYQDGILYNKYLKLLNLSNGFNELLILGIFLFNSSYYNYLSLVESLFQIDGDITAIALRKLTSGFVLFFSAYLISIFSFVNSIAQSSLPFFISLLSFSLVLHLSRRKNLIYMKLMPSMLFVPFFCFFITIIYIAQLN